MPPQPKRKISSRRRGKRRAGIKLTLPHLLKCPHCGRVKAGHRLCGNCRQY
ncbi:50S ribosomal protein L32 [Candidatus Beckwithbacteria bacterium CG22_combo_CG10-13_8_21_14_all_01_47_9]|uniref:Large ribosomal subunit protein bL32 n=4 Tax=Candidatus Beckwithiibacteriota TaxID=1752726 RepID=A0A2H0E0W3_9BACT|nr:MAG: 50S ribosomal protein L32 [Candidatus Beckwithbacteria bacterium CG23_combo_of_CG06-09_8_20_14_all_47_9]PIP88047.1 MAG: 50S ribosomal protein L32 [Candidatus Beckwithbacteria bacterium CG22_combo_CG10-13_8_21_14_all_01_47_9]PJA23263.1 MAG: 50S ribosomal protein L32 [Candidatus Beckwithbacteria bacterium CG_4_10_14_0_2_um_filter_47_25]PJC66353.1 MAG: 50S ribosomal protein L32 [Candidatus Beckwithbacteria bacterium CG_4_9_14_0_2_um_filter_47_11]